jgi:hypothetical protein
MTDLDFVTIRPADLMLAVISLREMARIRRAHAEKAPTEQARKMLTGNADAFDRAADKFAAYRRSI